MARRRVLTHAEARSFYDRFGEKQDLERLHADPAVERLLGAADFEHARVVVEFGCGTGRLAVRLLRERLPESAAYRGFDVSGTMVGIARARLVEWSDRATVVQTDGEPRVPVADGSCDRFVCTYVLDLLDDADIGAVLAEARRVLMPGGRLCLLSLTFGQTWVSRFVDRLWRSACAISPRLVGGCRPLRLRERLGAGWEIAHREVDCTWGLCTEIVVAVPRHAATPATDPHPLP